MPAADSQRPTLICKHIYTAHKLLRIETVHKHNGTKMCFNWSQNYRSNAVYFINEFFITVRISEMRMKLDKVSNWSSALFAQFIEMRQFFKVQFQ